MASNIDSARHTSASQDVTPEVTPEVTPDLTPDVSELERELSGLVVSSLNLEVAPADIDPNAALYGDGLGLDSIDILELALAVSQHYGFQLRADDESEHHIFQSMRTLAAYIAVHRTR